MADLQTQINVLARSIISSFTKLSQTKSEITETIKNYGGTETGYNPFDVVFKKNSSEEPILLNTSDNYSNIIFDEIIGEFVYTIPQIQYEISDNCTKLTKTDLTTKPYSSEEYTIYKATQNKNEIILSLTDKLENDLTLVLRNENTAFTNKYVLINNSEGGNSASFNLNVTEIDGHNHKEIIKAVNSAKKQDKATVIIANTTKGKGVSFMEDKAEWHGKAPNEEQYNMAMEELK